ncbi:MAG: DUF5665 domain-containing protein [Candidatus Saccharibacteria bacterium]|nr:DUF5665 domain-containing protein [Candidatus Saccharibacteria bacterium]
MAKIKTKIDKDNELGARRQLLEELFQDFHRSRVQIYWMNFTRGIFFGFGTLLGGTVLVAFTIWILGLFDTLPYIGEYIRNIINSLTMK